MGLFDTSFRSQDKPGTRSKTEKDNIDILVRKSPFLSGLCFEQDAEDEVKSAMIEVKFNEHQVIFRSETH